MASRPWYYVKGRRDLIEKQISKRREKIASRNAVNLQNNDYFNKWQFQNQMIEHWKTSDEQFKNRSKEPIHLQIPFDLDYDPTLTKKEKVNIETKVKTAINQLKCKINDLIDLENEIELILDQEKLIIDRIEQVLIMKKSLNDCRDQWKIKEKRVFYNRFARDKLRFKAFLILEQLNLYQMMIEALLNSSLDDLVQKQEAQDLNYIVTQSLQMLKTYNDLNHQRNDQYLLLYNEEAESQLSIYEACWLEEKEIWSVVIDQILETYFSIFRTKLEESLASQETLFLKREQMFQSLIENVENISKDNHLKYLLSKKLDELFLNQNEN